MNVNVNQQIETNDSEMVYKLNHFFNSTKEQTCDVKNFVKQQCTTKLFSALGINCKVNTNTHFLNFYSSVMGQAVISVLGLKLEIAPCNVKFVRYDGINFVNQATDYLLNSQSAFLDLYNLMDSKKELIKTISID